MTAARRAANPSLDGRAEQYREAERALWAEYGLEPVERFVQLREPSMRVRVLDIGTGDPAVFIPGTGGTGPYWAPLVREMTGFRCLLIDRPGWGSSDPIDWGNRDYGATAAAIVRGTLNDLGVDRAHLVGASVGNLWALHVARRDPERVGRIALVGAHPAADVPVPKFIRLLRSPIGALIVRAPLSAGALRSQLRAIGHSRTLAAGKLDDFLAWRLAFARLTSSMRHERGMVQAVLGPDGWRNGFIPAHADLAGIEHPTKMLLGSDDPTGPIETYRAFVDRLPNSEFQVVEGAGHMPWWDEPQIVARAVADFIGSTDQTGTSHGLQAVRG
jgi:pimeloyl-ACP methyl ester carboxylesterase